MKEFELDRILKEGKLTSEIELEQASIADRKLRLLESDDVVIRNKRKQLRELIYAYEQEHWSTATKVTNKKIDLSDHAEVLAEKQEEFVQKRKALIKTKLSRYNLNQQEFGKILGHKNKSYISELMNGVNPFSLKDIVVISKLLKIDLDDLVFKSISAEDQSKIERTIKSLDKPELKLDRIEFSLV